MPLLVLLADFPVRQSDAVDLVAGGVVRRAALGQLLVDAVGREYITTKWWFFCTPFYSNKPKHTFSLTDTRSKLLVGSPFADLNR